MSFTAEVAEKAFSEVSLAWHLQAMTTLRPQRVALLLRHRRSIYAGKLVAASRRRRCRGGIRAIVIAYGKEVANSADGMETASIAMV